MEKKKGTYESTLKFIEQEEILDRYVYRPIGFQFARMFNQLRFTPNMVTIISIFVGIGGGLCFYPNDLMMNLYGVLLLIMANILDCSDGMLARMTGKSSRIGRILDGFSGDLWFATIYICVGLHLIHFDQFSPWIFAAIVVSAISHSKQAAMADYFKNIHLYFFKETKGGEVEDMKKLQQQYDELYWKKDFLEKTFLYFYRNYTKFQEDLCPEFKRYKEIVASKYNGVVPERFIKEFNARHGKILLYVHSLSFSFRSVFLFAFVLTGIPWAYFIFEIVVLNVLLLLMVKNYNRVLNDLNTRLLK